ncbi:TolC family protein [Budvicia diplopodorum]|uniref:TolC family protein n=1 Tax=Budvicia diplopodorum TaxID=1119056 RepID=UPI0013573FC9|nr:TolC family protein [Budvicia diplopodorum]
MNIYKHFLLVAGLSCGATTSTMVMAQSLSEALQTAVNRSPTIKYYSGKVAAAESSVGEAKSGWLPSVSLSSGNDLLGRDDDDGNGQTYSVKVEQSLFNFGRTGDRVDYAKSSKDSELFNAVDESEILSSKVAEVYLNILKYRDLIEINNRNHQEHNNILMVAQARASGGVDSRGDVEQVEVRIKGLDAELSNYKAQLEAAKEDYLILIGRKPDGLSVPDIAFLKDKLAGHMRERIASSPRVQAIKVSKDAAKAEYEYTRKSWLPELTVSVVQGKTSTNGENDTRVMLNVNSNIFDGGGSIYRSQGAAQRVESARWNIEKSIEDLSTKVSQMYQEALSQENQAAIYAQRIIHSQEVKDLYHEQYKVNRRSVLDLLNSEQEFFQTLSNKANAEFNFKILLIRVFSELGEVNNAFNIQVNLEKNDDGNILSDTLGFANSSDKNQTNQNNKPDNQEKINVIKETAPELSPQIPANLPKSTDNITPLTTKDDNRNGDRKIDMDKEISIDKQTGVTCTGDCDFNQSSPPKNIEDPLLLLGLVK